MAEGEAQFVSPDEFMAGLQAMGFDVTQEEALTLASVLETDAEGNINLASLQQPGSPIMEQLAAMQGDADALLRCEYRPADDSRREARRSRREERRRDVSRWLARSEACTSAGQ